MEGKKEKSSNQAQETPYEDVAKTVVNEKPLKFTLRERELALREKSNQELEVALKELKQEFEKKDKDKSIDAEDINLVSLDEKQLEGLSLEYIESELEKCLEAYDNFEKSLIKDGRYESVKKAILPSSHSEGQDIYDADHLVKLDKKINELSGEIKRRGEDYSAPNLQDKVVGGVAEKNKKGLRDSLVSWFGSKK